ncbi:arginase family protein [Marinilabilia rubra]|uniref:Arginase n=1 Tax=Marinilabilia rubra TaxID=2162893 RepID=A0A2U2BB09_9BACT|nr:arginase family protein [Marinilabilia rubra]PWE00254.1 arginase [Marinilabilia rubra]
MELFHYLQPPKKNWIAYPGIPNQQSLGGEVDFFDGTEGWFQRAKIDVAILGVPEGRNSDFKDSENVPSEVRRWLYGMRNVSSDVRIADLGDVLGNTLNDRYQALGDVVSALVRENIQVLLIGGSQDLSLPASRFVSNYPGKYNIAVFDTFLDVDVLSQDFSASSFIPKLVEDLGESLEEISFLGNQLYYCSKEQEEYLRNHYFPVYRLRQLRGEKIDQCEVVLRDSTVMSFDMTSVKGEPGPVEGMLMPNGFSHEEACRIFWYAGASDNLKLAALFNLTSLARGDGNSHSGPLGAQMLWHFLEGYGARWRDFPFRPLEDYELKVVYFEEFDENLSFYYNSENERWWIKVPDSSCEKIVACHSDDYRLALEKELPEVWWRYFLKTNESVDLNKR